MGLKSYDLPPGGLTNGAVATPSNDVTFTWTYDQEEVAKIEPTEKDIKNVKISMPGISDEEVLIEAKLPLNNIFNPKFQPETQMPGTESQGGMTIVMRPQVAVHMMKVEIPSKVIEVINSHIDDELIPNADDFSSNLVGQINRSEKSAQLNFPKDDAGNEVSNILGKLASSYMKKVTDEEYETDVDDMWTVHSYEGDYNPLHDHGSKTPIGLSCILYLKVPDQIAALPNPSEEFNGLNGASGATDGFTYFTWGTHGMRDTNMLRPATEEYVKPEVGTMIMFPSWLRHSVNPFFGEGERRTFSANINVMKKVSTNEETN